MVFQKFMNFFFEEVDEEDEIDEVEDEEYEAPQPKKAVVVNETVKKESETPVAKEVAKPSMPDITLETPKDVGNEFIRKEESNKMEFYKVAEKPKTFIDLEDEAPVKEEPVMRREFPTRKVEIKDRRSVNYEFKTVISPIFGVTEKADELYVSKQASETKSTHHSESYLGTVFSPMYGSGEQKPVVEETATTKTVEYSNVNVQHELPPKYDIDDIISAPSRKQNKLEDTHQFTIFDEEYEEEEKKDDLIDELEISEFFDFNNK